MFTAFLIFGCFVTSWLFIKQTWNEHQFEKRARKTKEFQEMLKRVKL
jgi:hypothetical protein